MNTDMSAKLEKVLSERWAKNIDPVLKAKLIDGVRIGKNPWCASDFIEYQSSSLLDNYFGITEQETYDEAQLRFVKEGLTTQDEYDQRMKEDLEWKHGSYINGAISGIRHVIKFGRIDQFITKILEYYGIKISVELPDEQWRNKYGQRYDEIGL